MQFRPSTLSGVSEDARTFSVQSVYAPGATYGGGSETAEAVVSAASSLLSTFGPMLGGKKRKQQEAALSQSAAQAAEAQARAAAEATKRTYVLVGGALAIGAILVTGFVLTRPR